MKRIPIFIFLILLFQTSFSQIKRSISRKELEEKGFEITYHLDNFPADQLPSDSMKAYFGSLRVDDGYFVCLLFSNEDSLFQRSKIIRLPDEDTYRCKRPGASYHDGFIKTECQWMRGITCGEKYKVENGELFFVESFMYDLNEEVYKRAEVAQKLDDPIAYCVAYSGAQFYSMDMDYRAAESLSWAYKKALNLYKKKEFESAAEIIIELENECYIATFDALADFIPDECEKIWADVTLFYFKAGKYEECIDLSKRFLAVFDKVTGVYLQYGDALYETQNDDFKKVYDKYINLMKESEMESSIPSRVYDRVKM